MWYCSLEQYISKKNNTILAFEKMWTCLFDSYSDEILFSAFLIKYNISGAIKFFLKNKIVRVCVKDEWKCLLLLNIIISLFCLSYCKTNVVTKFIVLKTPVTP